MSGPSRVRTWRRLLLTGIVVLVGGVFALYWAGRAGRDQPAKPDGTELGAGNVTLAGQGFDYTLNQEDRPAFRIRGERIRSDRDDNVELEEVGLTVFRADGSRYELTAASALYNRQTRDARLNGQVRLSGPDRLAIATEGLALSRNAKELESEAPVTFELGGDLRGSANRLKAVIPSEVFILAGTVQVASAGREPPISLAAQRIGFERKQGMVRAEGDVMLRYGGSNLTARRLAAKVTPNEAGFEFLRANWEVHGELERGLAGAAPVGFRGDGLAVEFQSDGKTPERVSLEGKPVVITARGANDASQTLTAANLAGRFVAGALQSVDATGGVELRQVEGAVTRIATARRGEALFQGGAVVSVTLQEAVRLDDGRVKARADRAYLDIVADRGELFGDRVFAESERGDITAPHIVSSRDRGGLVTADGGVQALLKPATGRGAFGGTPLAAGSGPVRIEAREAFWQETPPTFSFQGGVRAWRGDNLLVADQVQGNEAQGQVTASGKVRTVWVPEPRSRGPAAGAAAPTTSTAPTSQGAAGGSPAAADRGPVEVTADTVLYRRQAREAVYTGNVRFEQSGRRVYCGEEARLFLSAQDQIEKMRCTGAVRLEDPAADRKVTGQAADYDVAAGTIVVTGKPVVLQDPARGRAEGARLIYSLTDGSVRLLATAAEPAPPGGGAQ